MDLRKQMGWMNVHNLCHGQVLQFFAKLPYDARSSLAQGFAVQNRRASVLRCYRKRFGERVSQAHESWTWFGAVDDQWHLYRERVCFFVLLWCRRQVLPESFVYLWYLWWESVLVAVLHIAHPGSHLSGYGVWSSSDPG